MSNTKNNRKTKTITNRLTSMELGNIYIVDFYDIKTETESRTILITQENNLAPIRTLGKLVKKTDLQITLSTFYNLDANDSEDEDFVHITRGCIYNVVELSIKE